MRTIIFFILIFVFSLITISCEKEEFTPSEKEIADKQFDQFSSYLRETVGFAETYAEAACPTCGVWALQKPTTGDGQFDQFSSYLRETVGFAETHAEAACPTCGAWALQKPTTGEEEALSPLPKERMVRPSSNILRQGDPRVSSKRVSLDGNF